MNKLLVKTLIFTSLILEVFLADLRFLTHKFTFDVDTTYQEIALNEMPGPTKDQDLIEVLSDIIGGDPSPGTPVADFREARILFAIQLHTQSLLQLKRTLHIDLPPPHLA